MITKNKLVTVFAIFLFIGSISFGAINAYASTVSANTDNILPAENYGDNRRNEAVSILIYNEYSDLTPVSGEYDRVRASLIGSLEGKFTYDNLTDYTQLGSIIEDYDILLIPEMELCNYSVVDTIALAWSGVLPSFVENGGIVICTTYGYSSSYPDRFVSPRILNGTGLMTVYDPSIATGHQLNLIDTSDALARNMPASYVSASGTISFDTTDGTVVMEDNTDSKAVVVHKIIGKGHVVLLGFDMFTVNANQDTLLQNSVLLYRNILFDNSHDQYTNINVGMSVISDDLPFYSFSVASMETFNPAMISACEILVIPMCDIAYNNSELQVIRDFVSNGGGLFIITEYGVFGDGLDGLLDEFGYVRNETGIIEDSDEYSDYEYWVDLGPENIPMHSTKIGVDIVELYASTGLIQLPESATPILTTDIDGTATWDGVNVAEGVPLAAADKVGEGRLILLCVSGPFSDVDVDGDGTSGDQDSDNELFIRNAFRWLAGAGIPEQTVVFDQSHSPYSYLHSGLAPLANFLMFNGYNIKYMSVFDPGAFADADILVIFDGSTNYTATEISQIRSYVAGGGGLLLWGDWTTYGVQVDQIGQEFGLHLNTTGYLEDTNDYNVYSSCLVYDDANFASHPIMDGVHRIEVDRSTGFISIGSGTALIRTDNDNTSKWLDGTPAPNIPVFAATLYNMGRVVFLTDVNMAESDDPDSDGFWDLYDSDNPIFVANVFTWLAENRAPSVEVISPNGGEVLNGTITVDWNAVDFDSDPMTFQVWYSDNNGSDWTLLEDGLTATEYAWNTTLHDDGNSYMIRVVASDGALTAHDDSDNPFSLDNYQPGPSGFPPGTIITLLIIAGVIIVVIVVIIVIKRRSK